MLYQSYYFCNSPLFASVFQIFHMRILRVQKHTALILTIFRFSSIFNQNKGRIKKVLRYFTISIPYFMKSFKFVALWIINKERVISRRHMSLEELVEVMIRLVSINFNLNKFRLLSLLFLKDKGFESFFGIL